MKTKSCEYQSMQSTPQQVHNCCRMAPCLSGTKGKDRLMNPQRSDLSDRESGRQFIIDMKGVLPDHTGMRKKSNCSSGLSEGHRKETTLPKASNSTYQIRSPRPHLTSEFSTPGLSTESLIHFMRADHRFMNAGGDQSKRKKKTYLGGKIIKEEESSPNEESKESTKPHQRPPVSNKK